ncbi:hypothetical protein ACWGJ6_49250, partial [Streptomyces canus]
MVHDEVRPCFLPGEIRVGRPQHSLSAARLASPYDPDARWAAKGEDLFWMGYKVHLTETCETPA